MQILRLATPLAIILISIYTCLFAGGTALGLMGPDEPRYAAIAREMLETGDWVTPRLQGTPWFEKPALYYWTAAASFRAFGVDEASARLPSGLAALLAVMGLAWMAFRITGRAAHEAALATLLVLPTTVAMIGFGRAATTDMLFASLLALAMVCASELVWSTTGSVQRIGWRVAWGATLGVAVLAKGPAAVVLASGATALWALASGRWRDSLRLAHPVIVVVFAAVALPWYVICALRNPDFVQVFLISHNVDRFLTPVFRHEQPFWFFGPVLLLGLVPWVALLALGVPELSAVLRVRRWNESRGFFVLCWVAFPIVFFSISRSKLPGYILPAVLPLGMLMARALARASEERSGLAARAMAAVGLTFVALAVTASAWQRKLPAGAMERLGEEANLTRWMWTLGASGVAIAILAFRRRIWIPLLLSAVVTCGLVLTVLKVGALLDVDLSARETAAEILRLKLDRAEESGTAPPGALGDRVGFVAAGDDVRVHKLHRAWHYGLNYYLHRAVPEWKEGTPQAHLLVVSDDGLLDLLSRGYRVRVAQRMNQRAILVYAEKARPRDP